MWTAPTLSVDRGARRLKSNPSPTSVSATHPPASPPLPIQPTSQPILAQYHSQNLTDLLEPAVDGPPSPESIRAFSQQMRQTSGQEKHQSRQTTSSGSSSVRSLASSSDHNSWEHAFDSGVALSRRSSGRSTASSMMQARERSDSVHIFGKSLFNRRGKLKRESSAQSSATSSLYSADMSFEAGMPPPTSAGTVSGSGSGSSNNIIPSLFSRRKTMRPDSVADDRRPRISGPYNFQHLTHTQKENLPNLQRSSRMALQSEFTAMRVSQVPSNGALKGILAEDLQSAAGLSAESLPRRLTVEEEIGSRDSLSRSLLQPSPSRTGLLERSRSQDQIRMAPPRPPRFDDVAFVTTPPVPPPRISSRASFRGDGTDVLVGGTNDRPQTSAGVHEVSRLSITMEEDYLHMRPHTRSQTQTVPEEHRYSRCLMAMPDDSNWPLTCPLNASFEAALPEVPEEEEEIALPARSRASIASNNSSLRGSQSVPLLRHLAASQGQSQSTTATTQRPPSNASDTLGRFDMFGAQRALRNALAESNSAESLPRESWEDLIDYCYEHEAEADCEYAWDRPSLELSRDEESVTPVEAEASFRRTDLTASPTLLTPGHFDLPALSPVSQMSSSTAVEAITPTTSSNLPVASNFSLPRSPMIDGKQVQPVQPAQPEQQSQQGQQPRFLLHGRRPSYASTFKESHGFNLSPSLLIPGSEYHHQMMLAEAESEWYQGQDTVTYLPYEEPVLTMDTSTLLIQPRTSASTVGSIDSGQMGSERHVSTASDSTALTRLTLSSTSIDKIDGLAISDDCSSPATLTGVGARAYTFDGSATAPAAESLIRSRGQSEPLKSPARFDDFAVGDDTTLTQRNFSHIIPSSPRKTKDDSTSFLTAPPSSPPSPLKTKDDSAAVAKLVKQRKDHTIQTRRPRAKTTSLATPPPPLGYSLYPAVNIAFSRM